MIIGRLGKDPHEVVLEGNRKMLCFPLVSTKIQKKEKVSIWYQCQVFRDFEFYKEFVKKGSLVLISGSLELPRLYFRKSDKKPDISLSLHVHKLDFLPNCTFNPQEKDHVIHDEDCEHTE